jgi:hypothetical protein
MLRSLGLSVSLLAIPLSLVPGCDKKEDDKAAEKSDKDGGDKADGKKDGRKSELMMTSDSEACTKAIRCCEEMVIAKDGSADPDKINLSCSGVAMTEKDEDCDAFGKGYAAAFGDKPVPEVCKYE